MAIQPIPDNPASPAQTQAPATITESAQQVLQSQTSPESNSEPWTNPGRGPGK